MLNIRGQLHNTKKWLYRRTQLGKLDAIEAIRARHGDEFVRLRDLIRTSGTDSLSHFGNGYTYEGGLSLQQNPDEFAALILLLKERQPYATYMEIGSASGGACLLLQREVGFERVLSLDNGEHPRAVEQKKNFSQIPNFQQFLGDSHSTAARDYLQQNVNGKIDVAFIDGDHSYEGVWQDIELTLPFCRPGTIIILHDTVACDGVERAWLRGVRERRFKPVAEFVGEEKPLGIGVGLSI
ncbi:MAG TPA: class I SAM-dependent methyltransferase [Pyrinomonadaceae bacterium]|jgi:predicted O-methyltransferase YrrM